MTVDSTMTFPYLTIHNPLFHSHFYPSPNINPTPLTPQPNKSRGEKNSSSSLYVLNLLHHRACHLHHPRLRDFQHNQQRDIRNYGVVSFRF
jgi:hypothetical protein